MYSFSVSPGSSFIILDHIQEGKDREQNEIKYEVDFALVLGVYENESWDSIADRLLRLFDTFLLLKRT